MNVVQLIVAACGVRANVDVTPIVMRKPRSQSEVLRIAAAGRLAGGRNAMTRSCRESVVGTIVLAANAGEHIAEEDDLYGNGGADRGTGDRPGGVGEIVCTNVVRELIAGKSYRFSEREPAALKGVEEPVRLVTVRSN
jgi:hypothetical protein